MQHDSALQQNQSVLNEFQVANSDNLLTNRERLDVPLHHVLLGHPLGAACAGLELW